MLATLGSLTPGILGKYFHVQLSGLGCQWGVTNNNHVCASHLCTPLLHSMPWPLRRLLAHHGVHGPRVAFAVAPKQIKGLVTLLIALLGPFSGLVFDWWP